MKKVGLIYDDIFLAHETPEWHPEAKERLTAIIDALKSSDVWDKLAHMRTTKRLSSQENRLCCAHNAKSNFEANLEALLSDSFAKAIINHKIYALI